jgi:hypothetical protein
MAVKFTKPEINVREKLAELDKPSGIAGEAMLRAETPQEQFNLIGAGRRNLLINGENKISQRGTYTTATAVTAGLYYIDRWKVYENTVTVTLTHKQNQALPDGSVSHTQRYDVTAAGTGYTGAQQILEETLTVGRYYTISAWVKSNDPNMNLFASGGHQRSFHSGSGEWEKLSITWLESGQGNSYGVINYTSGGNPMVIGNFVEFTQLQLELGKIATPFEHRLYGEELALCQRYYEILKYDTSTDSGGGAANETLIANGFAYSTSRSLNHLKFNEIKRTQPTVTIVGGVSKIEVLDTSGGWVTTTAFTARANIHGTRLDMTHPSSLTAGNALELRILSGGYLNIDAEL